MKLALVGATLIPLALIVAVSFWGYPQKPVMIGHSSNSSLENPLENPLESAPNSTLATQRVSAPPLDAEQVATALTALEQSPSVDELGLAHASLLLHGQAGNPAAALLAAQKYQLTYQLKQQGVLAYDGRERKILAELLALQHLPEGSSLAQLYQRKLNEAQKNAVAEGVVPAQ